MNPFRRQHKAGSLEWSMERLGRQLAYLVAYRFDQSWRRALIAHAVRSTLADLHRIGADDDARAVLQSFGHVAEAQAVIAQWEARRFDSESDR